MKQNLRSQWVSGKMDVENYRRKIAEIPLPSKASKPADEAAHKEPPPSPSPALPSQATPHRALPHQAQPSRDLSKSASSPETLVAPEPEVPDIPKEKPEAPKPPKPAPVPEPAPQEEPSEAPQKVTAPAPDEPLPEKKPAEAPTHTFKEVKPEEFIGHRNKSAKPEFLSDLKPEALQKHKLFTNQDNTIGGAVSPEGDIQNVFNNGGEKGAGAHAVAHAVEHHGGRTLDAYDGFLPKYYRQFGFHETGRTKFNPEYAPSGILLNMARLTSCIWAGADTRKAVLRPL